MFKVGDKVFVYIDSPYGEIYTLSIVSSISPSGKIIHLNNSALRYHADGWQMGDSYHRNHFVPLTDELLQMYNKWAIKQYVIQFKNWDRISDEKMERIYNILKE